MILFVPPPPPLSACLCVCVFFQKAPISSLFIFTVSQLSLFRGGSFFFFSLSLTLFGAVVILHREGVTAYNTALLLLLSFDFIASLLLYKYVYTELSLFRNGSARSRVSAFDYPRWWWQ